MTGARARRLLRWYPESFRARYGDELRALIDDELVAGRRGLRVGFDVARAGLAERLRVGGLTGRHLAPAERARANALLVLCAWALCSASGVALAKYAEHWDAGLSWPAKRASEVGFDVVSVAAAVGAVAVVTAALVCLGPLLGFVRGGGLRAVRRQLMTAALSTLAFAGFFAAVRGTATSPSSGGTGVHVLGVVFVVLGLVALATVTRAGVATARRLVIDPLRLRWLVRMGAVVSAVMTVVLAGTVLWWAAMPEPARGVVVMGPVLRLGTAGVDPVVAAIAAGLAVATTVGAVGAFRALQAVRAAGEVGTAAL